MLIGKIIISLLAVITLAGCASYSQNVSPIQDKGGSSQSATDQSVNGMPLDADVSASQIRVDLAEYSFSPSQISLEAGQTVTLALTNTGAIRHTFTVPDLNIDESLAAGESKNVTVTAKKSGTFQLLCTIPGHKELGMHGQVQVK